MVDRTTKGRGRAGTVEQVRRDLNGGATGHARLVVIGALFVAVTALRWQLDGAGESVALLYVVPIGAAAMWFGRRGGSVTAGIGVVAFVLLAAVRGRGDLDATGWVAPVLAMGLVGGLVGYLADLAANRAELGSIEAEQRRHLEQVCDTQHAALVAGDSVVQRVAAARWLLEVGRHDEAKEVLGTSVADGVASLSRGLAVGGATEKPGRSRGSRGVRPPVRPREGR